MPPAQFVECGMKIHDAGEPVRGLAHGSGAFPAAAWLVLRAQRSLSR